MLMMRLQRIGRKNEPHYRVVITDRRNAPKSGKFLEIVGSYNPKAGNVQVDADRVKHYLATGVQTSDTVYNFLVGQGIIEGRKKNKLPEKVAPVKEVVVEEAPAPVLETAPVVEDTAAEETSEVTEIVEEALAEAPAPEAEEAPTE
jgi:small subunit ribosomal protein S16